MLAHFFAMTAFVPKKALIFFMPEVSTFFSARTPCDMPAFLRFSSSSILRFFSALMSVASSSSRVRLRLNELVNRERAARASVLRLAMWSRWAVSGEKSMKFGIVEGDGKVSRRVSRVELR